MGLIGRLESTVGFTAACCPLRFITKRKNGTKFYPKKMLMKTALEGNSVHEEKALNHATKELKV